MSVITKKKFQVMLNKADAHARTQPGYRSFRNNQYHQQTDGDLRDALKILDQEDRDGAKIPLASYEKVWGALLALGRPVDTDTLARALTPAEANLEGRQAEMFAALIKGARTGNSLAVFHAEGLWRVA